MRSSTPLEDRLDERARRYLASAPASRIRPKRCGFTGFSTCASPVIRGAGSRRWWLPLAIAFLLVALFIWTAENIATWSGAWLYPSRVDGWHPVSLDKLVSWFLLMIISVVLVAWVYKPQPPEALQDATGGEDAPAEQGKVAY